MIYLFHQTYLNTHFDYPDIFPLSSRKTCFPPDLAEACQLKEVLRG